jgi:hypothetical protein
MMKVKNFAGIICTLFCFLFGVQAIAADWGIRGLLPRGTGYYDKNSIKKINKSIHQVWTVTILNEKGKADVFSMLKKQGKSPDNPEILDQELILLEFDCVKAKYRIVAMDIYDQNGKVLLSVSDIPDPWHDVIPQSINEKLKDMVCSK